MKKPHDLILVIISMLLPPLGIVIVTGINKDFWINVVLTLFGYLPGIIHAVYIIGRRSSALIEI